MNWEPWTGCYKVSDGCTYCYFYGPFSKRFGQNEVHKTKDFLRPIDKNEKNEFKIKGNKILATCFTSDFFIAEADEWRKEAWAIIKERSDIDFLILTKRIDRFNESLPSDWGEGYDNVNIGCTVENQELADYRLPIFLSFNIKHRFIACSPLLEAIDLTPYLSSVEHVTVAGESGREARLCDYSWIQSIREQCAKENITFWFKSTGSLFKNGDETKRINPYKQGSIAKEFGIDIIGNKKLF